jgi:hypothetical protein
MAMHVHSSFSEGTASMLAQLDQARANGVEVLWWTDHDWRMSAHGYRGTVHFTGLTESEAGGDPLKWTAAKLGSLSSSSMAISSTRFSPSDPVGASSLQIAATGTSSSSFATMRAIADASGARENLRSSIAGQTIVVDVFPESIGTKVFVEIRIKLSNQPESGGRVAGAYTLLYRIGGVDAPGTRRVTGLSGYVGLAATAGAWNTLTINPAADIALLWPDLEPTDSSMREISFAAGSKGYAPAVFYVDNLRFQRTTGGDEPMFAQQRIMSSLAARYPDVAQLQGLEVSLYTQHLNWFGTGVSLPDYGTTPMNPVPKDAAVVSELATRVHQVGGLSSLNHPFGTGGQALMSQSKQDGVRRSLAKTLLANRAYGTDLLEAGYASRSGVSLSGHLALWDTMSRNAMFLTGTGVNDNHGGAWATPANNFMTWAWATDATEPNLLSALAAGRAWFADSQWRGMIDLLADGMAPMGSVSVSSLNIRDLTVIVTDVPAGGSARLIKGPVDLAGAVAPDPGTVATSIAAADLAGGTLTVPIDTAAPAFVRVEVLDATGKVRASSNPIWLLKGEPPAGIPTPRRVA